MIHYKRLFEAELIKEFITEPWLWERVSEYGQQPEDFDAPITDAMHWIGLFEDDRLFGIGLMHGLNNTTVMIHINIQKDDRFKLSTKGGQLILQYFLNETDFQKINAEVPVIFKEVVKFTQSMGFSIEGLNRKSINKHNGLIDQINLGQTRNEVKEFLGKRI